MNSNLKNRIVIVSGPINSGKSLWAEKLLEGSNSVTYLATYVLNTNSLSWKNKIQKHKERRPKEWNLIESSDLISTLDLLDKDASLLIDSLGGIVSAYLNSITSEWNDISKTIVKALSNYSGLIVIVVEETGWGVSPSTEIGNVFRDRLCQLEKDIDEVSSDSWLVIHGRAINIFKNSIKV